MKKRVLLFSVVMLLGYISLSSYQSGLALIYGQNATGANGTATSCGGGGCHGGNSANTTVTITVDSGTIAVNHYKPGKTYTIRIHGTNSSNLAAFGFQFSSVSGTGTSQVNAGSYGTLPTGIHSATISGIKIVEQSYALRPAIAGVYDTSFSWTAPAAGTGTVTMYCTLNSVNGNGTNDPADVSHNTNTQLTELSSVTVNNVFDNMSLNLYPNPVVNTLHVQMAQATEGNYSIAVFDLNGKMLLHEETVVNNNNYEMSINTSNWNSGLYLVQIAKDGAVKTMKVIK